LYSVLLGNGELTLLSPLHTRSRKLELWMESGLGWGWVGFE
jgi:hypothetical protein